MCIRDSPWVLSCRLLRVEYVVPGESTSGWLFLYLKLTKIGCLLEVPRVVVSLSLVQTLVVHMLLYFNYSSHFAVLKSSSYISYTYILFFKRDVLGTFFFFLLYVFSLTPVSYTHLDVYKRQVVCLPSFYGISTFFFKYIPSTSVHTPR